MPAFADPSPAQPNLDSLASCAVLKGQPGDILEYRADDGARQDTEPGDG